jgi:hypothetical protein
MPFGVPVWSTWWEAQPDKVHRLHTEDHHDGWDFQPLSCLDAVVDPFGNRLGRVAVEILE